MDFRKSTRWKSKFARFVRSYGMGKLAKELNVHRSAIYHWIRAITRPKPEHAATIQRLARERRIRLTIDDIYGHSSHLRAIDQTILIDIGERKAKALSRLERVILPKNLLGSRTHTR